MSDWLLQISVLLVFAGLFFLGIGILVARKFTLRIKLLTAFIFISLAPLTLLAMLDYLSMNESIKTNASEKLFAIASQKAAQIDQYINNNLQDIGTQSKVDSFYRYLSLEPSLREGSKEEISARRTLRIFSGKNPTYLDSYALVDASGRVLLDSKIKSQGDDESTDLYFRQTIKLRKQYSAPLTFDHSGNGFLVFSSPVKKVNGIIVGVLRSRYRAPVLQSLVSSSRGAVGERSFAIIIDDNSMVLAHGANKNLVYTVLSKLTKKKTSDLKASKRIPDGARAAVSDNNELIKFLDRNRTVTNYLNTPLEGFQYDSFYLSSIMMKTHPWHVVQAQSVEAFLEPVSNQTKNTIIFVIAIAIILVVLAFVATVMLMAPIRRLTDIVSQIKSGDFTARATVEADDEVGNLAEVFNQMASNVRVLIDDLEKESSGHKIAAQSLQKFSQAIEQSPVSIMITDMKGSIEYVNPKCCQISGYSTSELIGKTPAILNSGETSKSVIKALWKTILSGGNWRGELFNKKKNGEMFWEHVFVSPIKTDGKKITHFLAIKEDITLRKQYEEKLLYQANYDRLTELPNRILAFDRMSQAITRAGRINAVVTIMYIDLDDFKNINDTLGHNVGDKFLQSVARRLTSCVRDTDTVARVGGDEFIIILSDFGEDLDSHAMAIRLLETISKSTAEKILNELSRPYSIDGLELYVTASIGISSYPVDCEDAHSLMRNADSAMYRCKRKGKNTYEIFTQEINDRAVKRMELEGHLRRAVENGELFLNYQPLMDAKNGQLVGAEALLRWNDNKLGNVPPDIFIPLAEESGLIVEIGQWVLEKACQDAKNWQGDNPVPLYVAVNLSSRQFRGKDIVKTIDQALVSSSLPGSCLELEITERLLMRDIPGVLDTLLQFKEMDTSLSIDDFGTGYSSLSYLKQFPFDVLKIDQSFVHDIGRDPDDEALCDAIIAMAHSLNLRVVGEGVENEKQYEFLRSKGADIVQGFHFSKPLTQKEFIQFISICDWVQSTM